MTVHRDHVIRLLMGFQTRLCVDNGCFVQTVNRDYAYQSPDGIRSWLLKIEIFPIARVTLVGDFPTFEELDEVQKRWVENSKIPLDILFAFVMLAKPEEDSGG